MDSQRIPRSSSSFTRTNQRFIIRSGSRSFGIQFSHLYSRRIAELRPLALAAATARWVSKDGDSADCEFMNCYTSLIRKIIPIFSIN
jgi:hypothetical protein